MTPRWARKRAAELTRLRREIADLHEVNQALRHALAVTPRAPSRDDLVQAVESVIDMRFSSAMPDWWPNTYEWAVAIVEELEALSALAPLDVDPRGISEVPGA